MAQRRDSGIFSCTDGDLEEDEDPNHVEANGPESEDDSESTLLEIILRQHDTKSGDSNMAPPWSREFSSFAGTSQDIPEAEDRSSTPPGRWPNTTARFYRSTSLRSALKSPSSKRNLKVVRFADALGLDLEHTRHILQTDTEKPLPKVPQEYLMQRSRVPTIGGKYLVPHFTLPSGYNTERLLRSQHVCLESLTVADLSLTGVIRVTNLTFEKSVLVRYSLDGWKSWWDVRASFIPGSSDGFTDKFVFSLFLPQTLRETSFCQFAIRYQAGTWEYWDNFNGTNYAVECCGPVRSLFSPGLDFF